MRCGSRLGGRGGFSLVEILVALALLAVALTATTLLVLGHHRAQLRAGRQMAAQGYLLDNMERLRAMAPLQEGRQVWKLDEGKTNPPAGIPAEGGRVVLDVAPWGDARPGENLQHVVLSLHWVDARGRRASAGLEAVMAGAVGAAP